jgi:hypothetical protein
MRGATLSEYNLRIFNGPPGRTVVVVKLCYVDNQGVCSRKGRLTSRVAREAKLVAYGRRSENDRQPARRLYEREELFPAGMELFRIRQRSWMNLPVWEGFEQPRAQFTRS